MTDAKCNCPAEAGSGTCELPKRTGAASCPTCGDRAKSVDAVTLKALLSVPLTELRASAYFFCSTPTCPTVYFAGDSHQRFTEASLREQVYQKHPDVDGLLVCYCFRHTPASIQGDLNQTGRTGVIEAITAGIKAGNCACEIRNPQGSCCLGNVRAVVQRLAAVPATRE